MSDICPAAGVIQSNSALALPCDHGKKLAKVNGTVTIAIDLVDLESLIKKEREDDEYHVDCEDRILDNPTTLFLTQHTPFRYTRKAYTSPWSWRSPLSPPSVSLLLQHNIPYPEARPRWGSS